MNPETKIENAACREVYTYLGITSVKLNISGQSGFPDRMFLLPGGRPLFVEYKVPGGEPEPHQQEIIDSLLELSYDVEVHTHDYETLEAICRILGTKNLSKTSREILARARRRSVVLRSRTR